MKMNSTTRNRKIIISLWICCILVAAMVTAGCQEKNDLIRTTGAITMKGSMPFPRTVFVSADGTSYEVAAEEARRMEQYQGKKIEIVAEVREVKLESVHGKFTHTRKILENIQVIETSPPRR